VHEFTRLGTGARARDAILDSRQASAPVLGSAPLPFALVSAGFDFWIGDDALRWANAVRWWSDPFFARRDDAWLVGG